MIQRYINLLFIDKYLFFINQNLCLFNKEQKNKAFAITICPAVHYIFSLLKKQEKGYRSHRG